MEAKHQGTELWHRQIITSFILTTLFERERIVLRTDPGSIPVVELCCRCHRGPATLLSWWTADDLLLESTPEVPKLGRKEKKRKMRRIHVVLRQISQASEPVQLGSYVPG